MGSSGRLRSLPDASQHPSQPDVPDAERRGIAALAQTLAERGEPRTLQDEGRRDALICHACPFSAAAGGVAWAMIGVPVGASATYRKPLLGEAISPFIALISEAWLLRLPRRRSGRATQLEQATARYALEPSPELSEMGQPELDRIVAALNHLNKRLAAAQEEFPALSQR
jgi:hypothetical protein